jgi:hypothetical protein
VPIEKCANHSTAANQREDLGSMRVLLCLALIALTLFAAIIYYQDSVIAKQREEVRLTAETWCGKKP